MLAAVAVFSLVTEVRNADLFTMVLAYCILHVSEILTVSSSKRNGYPVSTDNSAKQTEHYPPAEVIYHQHRKVALDIHCKTEKWKFQQCSLLLFGATI
jgi:hypothetical protein